MPLDVSAVTSQIDAILQQYVKLRKTAEYDDCSDLDDSLITGMVTRLAAAIDRFSPADSRYLKTQQSILESYGPNNGHSLAPLAGILTSLRDDIGSGYLATVTELVHADVFSDFLDMSQHLLDEGYKDAAAVITGSVLEEHLRKLCDKHGIATTNAGHPKKAESMNTDLAAKAVYSKTDQKNVTAWLGRRNEAAHGDYAAYDKALIAIYIQSIRDFATRIPA